MTLSQPNESLRVRSATHSGDEQALMQCRQVESAVEAVREGGEVSGRILAEVERVVAAGETGFQIAEHGVDPLKFRKVPRLRPATTVG